MDRAAKHASGVESMHIVVVGGGMAGIAAALALADDADISAVTLFEARSRLGGRVASVSDPETGMELDNCQHACFRIYDRFLQLLARADARAGVKLQSRTHLPFTDPADGRQSVLRDGRLSPPNHMLGSILKFPFMKLGDKTAMRKAVAALSRMDEEQRIALDDIPFDEWLRSNGQTEQAINRFWGFFVLAALNLPIEEASTAVAALLYKRGLFGSAHAFDVGAFQDHLSGAIDEPLRQALTIAGVNLRISTNVKSLLWKNGTCVGVSTGTETVNSDGVVLATPHHITARLLKAVGSPSSALQVSAGLERLDYRALIGIHAIYNGEKAPADFNFTALVDEPVIQMIFNRNRELSAANQLPNGVQWLSVPVSGADPYLKMSDAELKSEFTKVTDALWPNNDAELLRFFVVRTRKATFAPTPGSHKLRPSPGSAGEGLALAGDYTDHGWPSTMEGATRAGLRAAAHLLGRRWSDDEDWPNWPPSPKRGDEDWDEWHCE